MGRGKLEAGRASWNLNKLEAGGAGNYECKTIK